MVQHQVYPAHLLHMLAVVVVAHKADQVHQSMRLAAQVAAETPETQTEALEQQTQAEAEAEATTME